MFLILRKELKVVLLELYQLQLKKLRLCEFVNSPQIHLYISYPEINTPTTFRVPENREPSTHTNLVREDNKTIREYSIIFKNTYM